MTVEELLSRMSLDEFFHWGAHFNMRGGKSKQTPDEIRANLMLALAGRKKNKHVA